MPNVSAVIPCYNGKELLKNNLPPLIQEINIKEDEIIVVNDASTDGIGEFIKDTYPFIKLIELKQNMGYSYASNLGIAKSMYNLVLLMNTDVEVTPGFLKPLLRHFERKDVFAVCSLEVPLAGSKRDYALPTVEFKFGIFWYKYQPISGPLKEATPVLFAEGACTVYDRQKFLLLGGNDTIFKPIYWEDMDICFRAWKKGWQSLYEPQSLHWHRSQTTISKKYLHKYIKSFHWKHRFLFMWKNIKSPLLLMQHFLFLPFELLLLPLLGKKEFTLGFIYALKQLPDVINRRLKMERGEIFKDTDIIRRFKVPAYQCNAVALLNILYLHETAQISGAENSLINLVKKIDKSRFKPIFVLPQEGPFSFALKDLNIEVHFIRSPKIRKGLGVLGTINKILRLVKENNIRLIHSNSIRTHLYGAIAAKLAKIPVVWHQRNLITDEMLDPDRVFSFLPDKIICNSHAIARRFLRKGKLPEKMKVIYNGVDIERFNLDIDAQKIRNEFAIGYDEMVIGIASRFNPDKGHETFFRAAKILFQDKQISNLHFLVAGGAVFPQDKWREQYLRDVAEKLGIRERVIFTGFRQDMPQVYAAMDILILASDAEPCGRVLFEAMASGKPIIATDSGGTPEIVRDGLTGYLFDPGDYQALAEKISSLVNNINLAKKIGEEGRRRVVENFSIEKNSGEIEKLYLELIMK